MKLTSIKAEGYTHTHCMHNLKFFCGIWLFKNEKDIKILLSYCFFWRKNVMVVQTVPQWSTLRQPIYADFWLKTCEDYVLSFYIRCFPFDCFEKCVVAFISIVGLVSFIYWVILYIGIGLYAFASITLIKKEYKSYF